MVRKKTQLAVGAELDGIGVNAGREQVVGAANVDAGTVGEVLAVPALGGAIARYVPEFKADIVVIAEAVAIARWKFR